MPGEASKTMVELCLWPSIVLLCKFAIYCDYVQFILRTTDPLQKLWHSSFHKNPSLSAPPPSCCAICRPTNHLALRPPLHSSCPPSCLFIVLAGCCLSCCLCCWCLCNCCARANAHSLRWRCLQCCTFFGNRRCQRNDGNNTSAMRLLVWVQRWPRC